MKNRSVRGESEMTKLKELRKKTRKKLKADVYTAVYTDATNLLWVTILKLGSSQNVVDVIYHFTVEHHRSVLLIALTKHASVHH